MMDHTQLNEAGSRNGRPFQSARTPEPNLPPRVAHNFRRAYDELHKERRAVVRKAPARSVGASEEQGKGRMGVDPCSPGLICLYANQPKVPAPGSFRGHSCRRPLSFRARLCPKPLEVIPLPEPELHGAAQKAAARALGGAFDYTGAIVSLEDLHQEAESLEAEIQVRAAAA